MIVKHSGSLTVFEVYGGDIDINEVTDWCRSRPGCYTWSRVLDSGKLGVVRRTFWCETPNDALLFKLAWVNT